MYLRVFHTCTNEHTVEFRYRNTKTHIRTACLNAKIHIGQVQRWPCSSQKHFHGAADAIIGEIGIGMRQRDGPENTASVDGNPNIITTAKSIRLIDRACQRDSLAAGKTCADHYATGRLLDNVHIQVNLIGCAWYVNRINGGVGKKSKASDTIFRQANPVAVIP